MFRKTATSIASFARVNDREDGLRVRIEPELLVRMASVAVGAGAYLRTGRQPPRTRNSYTFRA